MIRHVLIVTLLLLAGACSKTGLGDEVRTDIASQFQSATGPITGCYAEALKSNRRARGMMVLDLAAAPESGAFVDVLVRRDEPADPNLTQCVLDVVAKLRLAKPQNARVTFTYPINFQPNK